MQANKVPVIALDGGPCSGKSTVMSALQGAEYDHPVVFIPEIAGELAEAELQPEGLDYAQLTQTDRERYLSLQRRIISGYIARIGTARESMASTGGVIVTDRAPAGIRAYVNAHEWPKLTAECGTTPEKIVTEYADAVVFLGTMALSDPEGYTRLRRSNAIRTESVRSAVALHYQSLACWQGHPNVVEIGGSNIEFKTTAVTGIIRAMTTHKL